MVAQTQKVLFLCNCCSMTLVPSLSDQSCCSGTTGRSKEAEWRQNHCQGGWRVAVVAEWRHRGRHSNRSMNAISRPKEAQWWYKKGRSAAQIDTQCSQQYVVFKGRPMADHCASILRPRWCVCLPPASFEQPVSDRPPQRPLCDCFEHAQNFMVTMASMAMSERPVYHPWMTKATVQPPFCLQRRPGQFCGRTREAERPQPLCKGSISYHSLHTVRCCYNMVIFLQNSHDRHLIAHPWGSVVSLKSDLCSVAAITVPFIVLWEIGPRYTSTQLYWEKKWWIGW